MTMVLKTVTFAVFLFLNLLCISYSQDNSNVINSLQYTPSSPAQAEPSIIVNISEPYNQVLISGYTIRLTCTAVSLKQKPVKISWSKYGSNLPQGRAYDDGNGHFVIVNAIISDSGTYVCTAFDEENYVTRNVSVTVLDGSAPKVSIAPEARTGRVQHKFKLGEVMEMTCDASGVPTPTVEWTRDNGFPISSSVTFGRNVLQVKADSFRNASGPYTCHARNVLGADTQTVNVIIYDPCVPEFMCESDYRCIPSTSKCNKISDCADNSDEKYCSVATSSTPTTSAWTTQSTPTVSLNLEPVNFVNNSCACDPRGSLSPDCVNSRCSCKTNVDGDHCDSCKPGTFDLQTYHKTGCLSCYCSGVSNTCQSSNFFVTQIPMLPLSEKHDFTLTTGSRDRVIKTGFTVDVRLNRVSYDYTTERGQELFWSLPSTFTGNQVTSYGGNLTWTQGYYAPTDAIPIYGDDVVIYGDGIYIHWTSNVYTASNRNIVKTLRLVEHEFRHVTKEGTQTASRSDMLRVLSNIESILIRASYASQTNLVFISDVSLDTAVLPPLSSVRTTLVEKCRCPTGYKGTSCEMCASGYYQVASQDGYVKECKKCPCNGREESCSLNINSRVVCKCRPGYSGEFCDG